MTTPCFAKGLLMASLLFASDASRADLLALTLSGYLDSGYDTTNELGLGSNVSLAGMAVEFELLLNVDALDGLYGDGSTYATWSGCNDGDCYNLNPEFLSTRFRVAGSSWQAFASTLDEFGLALDQDGAGALSSDVMAWSEYAYASSLLDGIETAQNRWVQFYFRDQFNAFLTSLDPNDLAGLDHTILAEDISFGEIGFSINDYVYDHNAGEYLDQHLANGSMWVSHVSIRRVEVPEPSGWLLMMAGLLAGARFVSYR